MRTFTVEHTSGGIKCYFCDNEQDLHSINFKTETMYGDVRRLRFCTPCSVRLKLDVDRAVNLRVGNE